MGITVQNRLGCLGKSLTGLIKSAESMMPLFTPNPTLYPVIRFEENGFINDLSILIFVSGLIHIFHTY
ncbi:hypothetical protein COY59_05275 [Candidatus Gottesmanbacteria bacterium CG_4_10_14_0_8_um_filter_37_24]|uniref:Uncharacterized protein n=1 Tax=Candidatus Gottesmanbacteria bacterium CG_4_10_14_0_8_um_filter_37_24 TaxID=1974574 RepID=A0A2M7RPZ5_9BACT|nr:MAG: hypothetical protein COX23_01940 [Candidatus Gottesmanbacteria bacterium CG23_combo_of_CG06-09_8_20_14_all_37_19]PIZ02396.1 MAG: hypothetical protein COY59_05275 [Candidatus Gottesmanbacteria bacterium CG_4_10_14_0_8_um_filter_37_24]